MDRVRAFSALCNFLHSPADGPVPTLRLNRPFDGLQRTEEVVCGRIQERRIRRDRGG
ncbi:protein of unknown function [Stenotrophomonas maltophilia]|nr:protein of unknown function [Stenotrophomonas maltophilia]